VINARLKYFLIAITVVAVVSDSMLIPFYPQFFASAFGITDPQYVGIYLAACCFVVMMAFPGWAHLARKVPPLELLIYTQFAAGILSVLCYWAASVWVFWVLSLGMLVFKGSYLLVYPYIMTLEDKDKHGGTIGLLSVIVHFGAILGALLGGLVLQYYAPRQAFLVMAVGDFVQAAVCIVLVIQDNAQKQASYTDPVAEPVEEAAEQTEPESMGSSRFVFKLSLVMLLFYFSAYLIRPFFAVYWESISVFKGEVAAGVVFSIPAFMALLALWLNRRKTDKADPFEGVAASLLWGMGGLLLQASGEETLVLVGRCLFGWAFFYSTVYLDLLVFKLSTPESYATDFSKIHFFQNLGVLIASFTAGSMVSLYGLTTPFVAAAFGFVVTMVCFQYLFKVERKSSRAALQTT